MCPIDSHDVLWILSGNTQSTSSYPFGVQLLRWIDFNPRMDKQSYAQ